MSSNVGKIYGSSVNGRPSIKIDSSNVDVTGNLSAKGFINFSITNDELASEDSSGIIYRLDTLDNSVNILDNSVNTLLTSNNDACFNNVDVSGSLNVQGEKVMTVPALDICGNDLSANTTYEITTGPTGNINNISFVKTNYAVLSGATFTGNVTAPSATITTLDTTQCTGNLNPAYNAGSGPVGGGPHLSVGREFGLRWYYMSCFSLFYSTGGLGSDDRIKHNEVDVSNGLNIMRQLTPKKYKKSLKMYDADYNGEIEGEWNWETGLIAQDILQIPDVSFCVKGGDRMVDGELKEECHYVDYNSIFTYAIAGLKELDTIVHQQAQLISSLEARLLALESK